MCSWANCLFFQFLITLVCVWSRCRWSWEECEQETWVVLGVESGDDDDFDINRGRVCVLSCSSHVQLFVTLWTVAHQAPLSMRFSRQEHWSGLPCPPPGEPRGFSRGVAGFSNYDGEFRMPLVLAQGSPIFHSSCEGKLGIALE